MKKVYNPESKEEVHTIINGNPTGIANFVNPTRAIYKTIFQGQLDRFWNPATVDLTDDMAKVADLSPDQYRMYELTFGKLIFNDSVVTNRIMDNINPMVTDPIANACLAFQAGEEALHSFSYAFIGDDVLKSTRIYDLWRTDEVLLELTKAINGRYSILDEPVELSDLGKALIAIANICLEGISFPAGFLPIWSLGNSMQGSASMITEISRNELGSHLPLYANIYKHIKEDCNLNGTNIDSRAKKLILEATEDEKEFLRYSTKGVMGFTDESINNFMDWIASNRLRELGISNNLNPNANEGLVKIFKSYSEVNDTKTNFFEGTVKNYSKQQITMDF